MRQLPKIKSSDKQILSLFLSLYLVVLVFLIAILSMSSFNGMRFEVGSESVREAFKNQFKSKEIRFASGNDAGFLLHTESNDDLGEDGNVFLKELPVLKVIETASGKIMYADLKRNEFLNGIEVKQDKLPFLKKIAEKMKKAEAGKRYEIEFLLGSDFKDKYPVYEDVIYRQAKALNEVMVNYGLSPYNIKTGVGNINYQNIRLIFKIIDEG